ncbi:MAG: LysR family transcriptional regulator [Nevskia sp.]|nr:LysR family transcriptional regulator [Nevskia sp.]
MRNLTLKQLRAVAAIARRGTITRAAEELHLTPAALTARLKQLEQDLGLMLFDRTASGLRPTEAGRLLLHAVERVGAVLAECGESLDALRGLSRGRLNIGVVSTAKYFAPRLIAAFARSHPGIEMGLQVYNREGTLRVLRDYEVDLAIMGRPSDAFEVEKEAFAEHPLVIIAAPDHPLARRKRLRFDQLGGETFLVREPGSGTRMVFENLCDEALRGERPRVGMEIPSNETIKQAVMAGLGIALISGHTVEAELRDGRLAMLPVAGLPIRRQWFLVRRADRHPSPAVQGFWDFLRREGAAMLPKLPLR